MSANTEGLRSRRDLGPLLIYDDYAQLRAVLNRPGFPDMLEIAITQPRRHGASDPFVLRRLFELLAEVAWRAPHLAGLATRVMLAQAGRWAPNSRIS